MIHSVFDLKGVPILCILFLVLFLFESRFPLRKRVQSRWKRITINTIVSIPAFTLLRFLFLPLMVWLAYKNQTWHLGLNHIYSLPPVVEGAIAFILLDYTNYLWHVLNHKLPALWRFHLVHHTDLDLDLTTAIRFHFGEIIGSVFFRGACTVLTGISPVAVLIYEIVFEAATQFHHSNWKLPFRIEQALNKVIVTPRMHGIHHSMIRNETDSNYAVIFSFWDRLHRTIRLNIHQHSLVTGVPAYSNPDELTVKHLLTMPFTRIRPWHTPNDERTTRESVPDKNELVE
ncbi:MAG: sterol desaturase family protein [Flavisolibacter sp.]|nr:sterol desaturase family protein [Flavisolibacter sp.]